MEKSITFVFCLIVVNACLLSTFGVAAEKEGKESNKLWGEVWKSIQKDNERIGGDKLTRPRDGWENLLQKRLDEESSPLGSSTKGHFKSQTPAATPTVNLSKNVDVKKLLNFLKESGVTLSNDQWMSLLRHVLSAKSKATPATTTATTINTTTPTTTTTTTTTTSIPTTTTTTPTTAPTSTTTTTESINEHNWFSVLQQAVDAKRDLTQMEKNKIIALFKTTRPLTDTTSITTPSKKAFNKDAIISDDVWTRLQTRMDSEVNEVNSNKRKLTTSQTLSATSTTTPTFTPKLNSDKKKEISITNVQWNALLDRAFGYSGDGILSGNKLGLKPSELPKTTKNPKAWHGMAADDNGVISDKEWDRALLEMAGQLDTQGGDDEGITRKTPEAQSVKPTISGHGSHSANPDTEWEHILQDALDKNNAVSDGKLGKLAPPKSTSDHNRNWEQNLQDMLDKDQGLRNTQSTTIETPIPQEDGSVSDPEWDRLVEEAFAANRAWKDGHFVTKAKLTPDSVDLGITQSTTIETPMPQEDGDVSDPEWDRLVEEAFAGNHAWKDGHFVTKTKLTPDSATPTTRETNYNKNNDNNAQGNFDQELTEQLEAAFSLAPLESSPQPPTRLTTTKASSKGNANVDDNFDKTVADKEWNDLVKAHGLSDFTGQVDLKTHPTTQKPNSNGNVMSKNEISDETMADKEWDNLMEAHGLTGFPTKEDLTTKSSTPDYKATADDEWNRLLKAYDISDEILNTKSSTLESKIKPEEASSENQKLSHSSPTPEPFFSAKSIKNDVSETKNFNLLLGFSIGCGLLVVILVVAALLTVCRMKRMLCWNRKDIHTTVLNSDGNRWNPQALRPSKENMNAFLYSIPTPMREIKIEY